MPYVCKTQHGQSHASCRLHMDAMHGISATDTHQHQADVSACVEITRPMHARRQLTLKSIFVLCRALALLCGMALATATGLIIGRHVMSYGLTKHGAHENNITKETIPLQLLAAHIQPRWPAYAVVIGISIAVWWCVTHEVFWRPASRFSAATQVVHSNPSMHATELRNATPENAAQKNLSWQVKPRPAKVQFGAFKAQSSL